MRFPILLRPIFALVMVGVPAAPTGAQPLNDSGQTACFDESSTTNVGRVSPATPDPEPAGFDEQDCTRGAAAADALGRMVKVGGSSVPGRDYSKIGNDGSVLPASAVLGGAPSDWGCTRDNVTGLIWEIKTDDNGLRDKDWTFTWYDTNATVNGANVGTLGDGSTCNSTLPQCNTTAYRNALNALAGAARLCAATDWRLPTANELSSLVNADVPDFVFDTVWFPNTAIGDYYWTAETYAPNVSFAWYVNHNWGSVFAYPKNFNQSVRLVRGGL